MFSQNVQLKSDDSWISDHESYEKNNKNDLTKRMRDHKRRAERDMFLMREADHSTYEVEVLPKATKAMDSSSPRRSADSKEDDGVALISHPRTAIGFVK